MPTIPTDTYDITIYQGADFTVIFEFVDSNGDAISLADLDVALLQMRPTPESETVLLEAELGAGLTVSGNELTVLIPGADTDEVTVDGVWDLYCEFSDGTKARPLQGRALISLRVSRPVTP